MRTITPLGSEASTDPRDPKTPALADADTSILEFVGRSASVKAQVSSCKLERTIEGASSLDVTIHDPHLAFLNSPALEGVPAAPAIQDPRRKPKPPVEGANRPLESAVILDNLVFALAGVSLGEGHLVTATLEDEAVHRLRQFFSPLTMSRDHVTRAQFIKHMFDEAGVELICPELEQKQKIETQAEAEKAANRNRKRRLGISAHAQLTVKQKPVDSEQRRNIEAALEVCASHFSGEVAAIALLEAIIVESECRNTPTGDGTSRGIFQLLASTASGLHVDPMDIHAVCALFLTRGFTGQGGAIALAKEHPSWTPGQIAQAVQGSKFPDRYQVWVAEATAMVKAFSGGNAEALQTNQTFVKGYQFRRGGPNGEREDSWTASRRLAEEVNWYLFIVAGTGYLFSGERLLSSKPRMLVAPGADGLIGHPTFNYWASPLHEDTVTVRCHASKWGAPPGSVAEVEGYGPVDGRWIVTSIARDRMKSSVTTIVLGRPKKKKKEPPHETGTRTTGSEGKSEPRTALAAYEAATTLSSYALPYLYGGGHATHGLRNIRAGGGGIDCSASTAWVLWTAGMFDGDSAWVSGKNAAGAPNFAENWGAPGQGKEMTIWANAEHVWIEFTIPGKPHSRIDTVSARGGPELQSTEPPEGRASFTPRHWPGT